MSTTDPSVGIDECVAAVEAFFLHLRDGLAEVADSTAHGVPTTASPDEVAAVVEPLAAGLLEDRRLLGGGFIANPEVLAEAGLTAWWQGEHRERLHLPKVLGREADYEGKEWFLTPLRTGELHVTGPYIDYVCSDEFVLTATLPVVGGGGEPLGLAGADILAETLEAELVGVFEAAGATLVNHHDRIVVPGHHRSFAGDRVDPETFEDQAECRDLPLRVLR